MAEFPLSEDEIETEVQQLNDNFVAWATGETDDFSLIVDRLARDFELITDSEGRLSRAEMMESYEPFYDAFAPGEYELTVETVELVHGGDDHAFVRYEENEAVAGDVDRHVCSAMLVPDEDAPNGIAWLSLEQTTI